MKEILGSKDDVSLSKLEEYIDILENGGKLERDELEELLVSDAHIPIYRAADRVRRKCVGDDIHLRGLIEFSSYCCRTCTYCGLRAPNIKIKRYRLDKDEIFQCAQNAVQHYRLRTIVLQSGEDREFRINDLCKIVDKIKKLDVAVTLSIGELPREEYAELKKAGADRFLLRIESTNRELYERCHPGMSHGNRIRCLYDLKELGYETGTGSLVGIPGQTAKMLADDLLFFKKIDVDMLGIGPFIPCPDTPFEGNAGGEIDIVLKMVALARLLMPDINIPATTALGVKDGDGHKKGLSCGANVIMPNVGPREYKTLYAIYPGKGGEAAGIDNQITRIQTLASQLGRNISEDYGFRR